MIIDGVVIHDSFMYETVKSIAEESGITDKNIILETYQELYNKTDAKNKSWNCRMIDRILAKKVGN